MQIKNLTADFTHEGDEVKISFKMPTGQFLKLVEVLKATPRAVKEKAGSIPFNTRKDAFYSKIMDYTNEFPKKYPSGMYGKFFSWWTEPTPNGKTMRFEEQKFFDIGRRLATWKSKMKPEELNAMWLLHNEAIKKTQLFK